MKTLALRGLEEPAHASRALEEPFFQLCCCVSFWFWQEIGFGCTYYYVLGRPYSCGVVLVFWFWREIVFGVMYVLSVQYSCAVVSFFCCGGKVNCKHRQSHIDFLKNDYSVSLFSRNNSLAKTYFLWNPNFLLLHISFFFSINQHHYNHDRFSKISRSFCGSRNWWVIIVFF